MLKNVELLTTLSELFAIDLKPFKLEHNRERWENRRSLGQHFMEMLIGMQI